MKSLVINADDFGAAAPVNEAIEQAHRRGVLSATSLMVTGGALADAVARARRMPGLRIGLHLDVIEQRPTLPPQQIPGLVDAAGLFHHGLLKAGLNALRPTVRRQLAAEIESQFRAFAATGLALDHVNGHRHFHIHPAVGELVLRIGQSYGMKAIRAPLEPQKIRRSIDAQPLVSAGLLAAPLARSLARRAREAGLTVADRVFGWDWSGAMTSTRLAALIRRLPEGLSEIFMHPATTGAFAFSAPGYRYEEELAALLSPEVADAVREAGARLGGYGDFLGRAAGP